MSCHELSGRDRQLEALQAALHGRFGVSAATVDGADRIQTRGFSVVDEWQKTVVRLTLALPSEPAGPWGTEFDARHARLGLTALRGYDVEYAQVAQLLPAAGFTVEGVNDGVEVALRPDERADVAVARVLRRLLEVQDANLPGALADIDSEFLHDYRVAVRRTRSVQREMRGVFIADELLYLRQEFSWLQSVTSATRDLDVYIEDFEELRAFVPESMRTDLDPLRELLVSRREGVRLEMEQALVGKRARALHDEWEEILQVLVLENESERPDAARPIVELACERIRRVHRRMVKMGRAIGPESVPQEYHDLRKRGKELRYLLELFAAPLFDPEIVRPMVRALKGLQDVLGRHQDREVQVEMLRGVVFELLTGPEAAHTVMAVGVLIDRLQADASAARKRFADSFAEFASAEQLALVEATFA